MALNLAKLMPAGIMDLDTSGDLTDFLTVFSTVYDQMVDETTEVLWLQDPDLCPEWSLPYIANLLGAEILRLDLIENGDFEAGQELDGTPYEWNENGVATTLLESNRRNSSAVNLTTSFDNVGLFQAITLLAERVVVEVKLKVDSGQVRFGDLSNHTNTLAVTAAANLGVWQTYRTIHTATAGSRQYGVESAGGAGAHFHFDDFRVYRLSKVNLMRVWLRNAVAQYKIKGCKTNIEAIVTYFTGQTVSSWVEQKLPYYPLMYNRVGNVYCDFGTGLAAAPNSVEWNTLGDTPDDMVARYYDHGYIWNGLFEDDDFVNGANPAYFVRSSTDVIITNEKFYSGTKAVKLTGATTSLNQTPTVPVSKYMAFTAWVYVPSGQTWTTRPRIRVGGGAWTSSVAVNEDGWEMLTAILPITNADSTPVVEIGAVGASASNVYYTDCWFLVQRKWVELTVTDPGVSLRTEYEELLESILPNYLPAGVDVSVVFA